MSPSKHLLNKDCLSLRVMYVLALVLLLSISFLFKSVFREIIFLRGTSLITRRVLRCIPRQILGFFERFDWSNAFWSAKVVYGVKKVGQKRFRFQVFPQNSL
jgi:hypothetical protein